MRWLLLLQAIDLSLQLRLHMCSKAKNWWKSTTYRVVGVRVRDLRYGTSILPSAPREAGSCCEMKMSSGKVDQVTGAARLRTGGPAAWAARCSAILCISGLLSQVAAICEVLRANPHSCSVDELLDDTTIRGPTAGLSVL